MKHTFKAHLACLIGITVWQKILEGVKFGKLLNFDDWRILIWQISGHVPLSMCIMAQNGGFYFGEWLSKKCQIHPI